MAQSLSTTPIGDGYLYKKGVYNTSWKRRYFVLYDDRTMDYFKDKAHSMNRNKAKGTIKLMHIQKVELMQFIHCKSTKESLPDSDYLYTNNSSNIISSLHPPPSYSNIVKSDKLQPDNTHSDEKVSFKKCDRPYAFALISNAREWKLSAENEQELKHWIVTLSKLCRGDEIFDGYLNDNHTKSSSKHFVLYKNKVLNCYINNKIEFDVDLKRVLYLKYDRNMSIELVISNRKQAILLTAPNTQNAHEWLMKIKSLFSQKDLIRCLYDTLAESVHIAHDKKRMESKYIAIYRPYFVIFDDKSTYERIRNMLFFDRRMFRDYLIKQKCTLIPVNTNIKLRKSSKTTPNSFILSNVVGDRKWSISVESKKVLKQILQFIDVSAIGRYKKRVSNPNNDETEQLNVPEADQDDDLSIPYTPRSGISLPTIEETRAIV